MTFDETAAAERLKKLIDRAAGEMAAELPVEVSERDLWYMRIALRTVCRSVVSGETEHLARYFMRYSEESDMRMSADLN